MMTLAKAISRPIFSKLLLFSASFFLQCCNAAPVNPDAKKSCSITPDTTIIHDASCLHKDLREYASSLGRYFTNCADLLRCELEPFSPTSQPLHILNALANKVEALSQIQESAINASYSDYVCRMKETVIPYLNETLTSVCSCSDESCETNIPYDMSNSDGSLEYGNEYCLVNNIQIHLGDLLNRITVDKHVKPIVTRQCIVNLDTRYQLAKLRNDINGAEKDLRHRISACPSLGNTSSLASECVLTLSGLKELIPRLTHYGQESLAEHLSISLPKIAGLYGSENGICPLPALPSNMNEYCVVSYLKTFYFTIYQSIKIQLQSRNIVLEYMTCPAPEDIAAFPDVNSGANTAPTAAPTSIVINPPSESIPQRPRSS